MKPLAESVSKLARPLIGRRGFTQAEILLKWAEIVGDDLARISLPVKLSFPRKDAGGRTNGTLHLKVEAVAALELQHMEPQIIGRVNLFCGYPAVARLSMRQTHLPPPPATAQPLRRLRKEEEAALHTATAAIKDPELRDVLERLGRAVLGSQPPA